MANWTKERIKYVILLSLTLTASLALVGCQGSTDDDGEQEQADAEVEVTPTPSQALPIISITTPSPALLTTPDPSQQAYNDQILLETVSKKVREYFTAPLENEYAVIFNKLEVETLILMAVAADKRVMKVDKESYPSFEEFKPELLKYNSEQALEPWTYVYEQSPGWLLEPYDLLYAHRMVESSLAVTEKEADRIKLAFKVYGNQHSFKLYGNQKVTTPTSKLITVTMVRVDEGWKVDSIQAEAVAHAFTKEEVDAIMAKVLPDGEYQGEDEKYYYYLAEQNEYVFDKENGYYDFAPDVISESVAP